MKTTKQIIELLREDKANTALIMAKLKDYAEENDECYAEALKLLTHLEFDKDEAKTHWDAIVAHMEDMTQKLDRDVGLRVALMDYFTHINKQIENPKIIEIAIFEQTIASVMTDPLTNIYNRRYFEESLFREFQRAKRYDLVMSAMMIDIDDFKRYNDAFGHPEGDVVLTEVANMIRKSCRDSDIPCRYGGEEFCVIMPETAGPDALHLAHRITNMVKTYSSSISERHAWKRTVTLSCGVASYPIDAKYPKELIQKADLALYQAKRDGKNRAYLYYEERRRYARMDRSWIVQMKIIDPLPAVVPFPAHENLNGIVFEHPEAIIIGTAVEIELKIPDNPQTIHVLMKVNRLEGRADGKFDLGLNFISISEQDIHSLDEYITGISEDTQFAKSIRI